MKDPICGMEVAEPPKIKAERTGIVYGFCSERCRAAFEAGQGAKPMVEIPNPAKGYWVLAAVFAVILVFTFFRRNAAGDWSMTETMSDFMGAFFVLFGAFKLMDLNAFADAYATYDIIGAKIRAYSLSYPFLQILFGVSYLTRFQPPLTNTASLLIMSISSIGVAKALLSRKKIRCACLGTRIQLPMTTISLTEDILMALMAGVMLVIR